MIRGIIDNDTRMVEWLDDNSLIQGGHLVQDLIFYDSVERDENDVAMFNFVLPDGTSTRSYLASYEGTETVDDVLYYTYRMQVDKMVLFHKANITGTSIFVSLSIINASNNTIRNTVSADLDIDPSALLVMDNTAIDDSEYLEIMEAVSNLEDKFESTTAECSFDSSINAAEVEVTVGDNLHFNFSFPTDRVKCLTIENWSMSDLEIGDEYQMPLSAAQLETINVGDLAMVIHEDNTMMFLARILYILDSGADFRLESENIVIKGEKGDTGQTGATGQTGQTGQTGATGKSALTVDGVVNVSSDPLINQSIAISTGSLSRVPENGDWISFIAYNTVSGETFLCNALYVIEEGYYQRFRYHFVHSTKGAKGEKGEDGDSFAIFRTYQSVAEMNNDSGNVEEGKFVLIASNTEDVDNAKLYVKSHNDFRYLTDLSGSKGFKGDKGDTGNGISTIEKYQADDHANITIRMTDGTHQTFTVYYGDKGDTGNAALVYADKLTHDDFPFGRSDGRIRIYGNSEFNRNVEVGDIVTFYYGTEMIIAHCTASYGSPLENWFVEDDSINIKGDTGGQGSQGETGAKGNPCCLSGKTWSGSLTLMSQTSTTDAGIFQYWNIPFGEELWFLLPASDGYVYQCYGEITKLSASSWRLDFIPINKTRIKGDTGEPGYGTGIIIYESETVPEVGDIVIINPEEYAISSDNLSYCMLVAKVNNESYAFSGELQGEAAEGIAFEVETEPIKIGKEISLTSELTNDSNFAYKPTIEEIEISAAEWEETNLEPYTYSATVTATTTIGANSVVELVNNAAVLFATYGFAIGGISGQNIIFYAVDVPLTSTTLTLFIS